MLKVLIAEDDFIARKILNLGLARFGQCDVAVDGKEALDAVRFALDDGRPYNLICLDIMMPRMTGQEALREIRELETCRGIPLGKGAKIIMTTALSDSKNVMAAFREFCDGYIVKPITKEKLEAKLLELGLIEAGT